MARTHNKTLPPTHLEILRTVAIREAAKRERRTISGFILNAVLNRIANQKKIEQAWRKAPRGGKQARAAAPLPNVPFCLQASLIVPWPVKACMTCSGIVCVSAPAVGDEGSSSASEVSKSLPPPLAV